MGDVTNLVRRLDDIFEPWNAALPSDQRSAIRRWQDMDRFYEQVQAAALGDEASNEAFDILHALLDATNVPLSEGVTVWRGVDQACAPFGVERTRLGEVVGHDEVLDRFLACTADPAIATAQFVAPELLGGAVVIRVRVRRGVRCAWVSLAGNPDARDQYELLLRPGARLRIVGVSTASRPIIDVEVS